MLRGGEEAVGDKFLHSTYIYIYSADHMLGVVLAYFGWWCSLDVFLKKPCGKIVNKINNAKC